MFCSCKDCKKMRRKGKVIGTRNMGFWINKEYYFGPVTAYVDFPKFMKGRKRKEKWEKLNGL